jgi:inorganic triphosphatase YgiF
MRNKDDDRREAEIKLLISAESPVTVMDAIASLHEIDGHRLGPARIRVLRDTYFDTPDRRLRERRFNLRLRTDDGRLLMTLKGPKSSVGSGVVMRSEIEAPWSRQTVDRIRGVLAQADIDMGEAPEITDPVGTLRKSGLAPLQSRQTERHARDVLDGSGRPLAELVLDAVTYLFGDYEIRHHEVEIEADDAADAASLEPLAHNLLARFGGVLRPWRRGKLATGLAIRDLLEEGSLASHVDGSTLRPGAYDLIERHLAAERRSGRNIQAHAAQP